MTNDNSRPNSKSRSRSREPAHAAGRGGFGNVIVGGPTEKAIEELDESERAAHQHAAGLCVVFFFFAFSKCGPADHGLFCSYFSGTPLGGEAWGTLRIARYRTARAPETPMVSITRI